MIRSHGAGSLRAEDAGSTVSLAGWVASRRDHGGVAFLDLRDASGVVQVVVRDTAIAHALRDEYCLKITGTVQLRPSGNENADLATGAIEVMGDSVEILSSSAPLPFPIDDRVSVGDEVRLKYRYLDLRRHSPGTALRMRSRVNQIARNVLLERDFVEIETPTLTRSTLRVRGISWSRCACSPVIGTPCRNHHNFSNSCSWWRGWSGIFKSHAAIAMRIFVLTDNRSSPNSISRCRSSNKTMSSR